MVATFKNILEWKKIISAQMVGMKTFFKTSNVNSSYQQNRL